MPENLKNCPLCGHGDYSHFETITFRGEKVVNQICDHCGLVFQSPRMTAAEADIFYAREYRQVYQDEAGPVGKDLKIQQQRAGLLLDFVRVAVPRIDRHLDIGCSAGILLEVIQGHYGCQPVGIEPGDSYREFAQKKGLKVYADLDGLKAASEPCFDLISMAHVLEHIPAPVEYLRGLGTQYLTPSGWLLVEVPNLYAHDSFEIAHMTAFSQHSLIQTLQKAGFQVVAAKKHGQPRSDLLPLYLTVLARAAIDDLDRTVQPESNVALKRKASMFRRKILQRLFPRRAWKAVV